MASGMNEANDQDFARKIQVLREEAERAVTLGVTPLCDSITIYCEIPGKEFLCTKIIMEVRDNKPQYEQVKAAVGEILAQNHAQLHLFRLHEIDSLGSDYPQFWRGLAANRILKEVNFNRVTIPNEPAAACFLANPALESVDMSHCSFSDGAFDSFCQAIQSSRIKKLKIVFRFHTEGDSWSLLWSALEHGATRLESLDANFDDNSIHGAENGFESFLANNTNIQRLCLQGFGNGRDDLPLLVALGRGLAVNTTVKILDLNFNSREPNTTGNKQLIQTAFAEGIDRNMAVKSLTVNMTANPGTINTLADCLERMMRNRANAATLGGHNQEGSLPVLKELVINCTNSNRDISAVGAIRDELFDRLSRSDVILVENVKLDLPVVVPSLSSKLYDFIRSTQVTKSLALITCYALPLDDECLVDLADAMEANNSISELGVGHEQFHTTTNLLSSPNKYRICCQLRRNKLKVLSLQKGENLILLPLVLARLLSPDDTHEDDEERSDIEARLSVGRTIVFEILKDIPALFAVYGKRKRED